jgi:alkylhydroperoxidase/carboxymuconolactone decarboxylase family protein YurZ
MNELPIPAHYQALKARYPEVMAALEALGAATRAQGPLDELSSHLVSMAAAAAVGSEGAVHSHARRALAAGASVDQVRHAVLLLVTTIGFPRAAAAMSWVDEVVDGTPGGGVGRR